MPFFTWSGIDSSGTYQRGNQPARTSTELLTLLASKNIAVINHKQIHPKAAHAFKLKHKAAFFRQLASLVGSGIYINQALELIALQEKSAARKELFTELFLEVDQGNTLGATFAQYSAMFDPLTLQTIQAAQQSGLLQALETLAHYYEQVSLFRTRLRQALMMPLITALFFVGITLVIFIGILPTFVSLFHSLNQPMPPLTQFMMQVSNFLSSWNALFLSASIIIAISWFWWSSSTNRCKQRIKEWFFWHGPCSPLLRALYVCRFFQSLILLLESGVPMKTTLETLNATSNNPLTPQLHHITNAVLMGIPFDEALAAHPQLFSPDICAYVRIGQETGTLSILLNKVVQNYQQKIENQLNFFTTILQPLVLVILGIWIALLIIGIYMPIFNMSYAIG